MGLIKVVSERDKGNEVCAPFVSMRTFDKALELLVTCELGFNGHVVSVASDALVVQTTCMGCLDTTTFTGAEGDLDFLNCIALEYMRFRKDSPTEFVQTKNQQEDALAWALHQLHPIMAGGNAVKIAIVEVCGFSELVGNHSVEDLCAAASLYHEGANKADIYEILSMPTNNVATDKHYKGW